ncbi:hypothetical protein N8I77_007650 [Diaporthe amygdali]|uniref:Decarboxylase DEC1 n=1 Tax=Phomopsis amygdali TaxID=1214568 RepID=A0AAD9W254_PHOAM|nr:hypothetical protein N8I77_007650 [Diaporthe amygdali]
MPLGSLLVTAEGVPIYAPPYPTHQDPYTFIIDKVLSVSYRVAASQVRHLVPDMLELEDEPLMTSSFIEYGMSLVGSYKEYVHNVEVSYKGEKFNYHLILILDNESAIFAGREQYGFPKVFGKAEIEPETGSRLVTANAQRPAGRTVVDCEFIPEALVNKPPGPNKWSLNLRSIQQPHPGMAPPILELVPVFMDMHLTEVWTGKAQIDFPRRSAHNPWCELDILRYEGSSLARNVTATLQVRGSLPL